MGKLGTGLLNTVIYECPKQKRYAKEDDMVELAMIIVVIFGSKM